MTVGGEPPPVLVFTSRHPNGLISAKAIGMTGSENTTRSSRFILLEVTFLDSNLVAAGTLFVNSFGNRAE